MAKKASKIDNLPDGIHRIEPCLYVRKRTGRPTSWLYVYTVATKRKEVAIGRTDTMSITVARAQLNKMRELVAQGIDPVARRREMQAAYAPKEKPYCFSDLVHEALPVIESTKHWRGTKAKAQWEASLSAYALPVIGQKEIMKITRDDVLEVLRPIWETKTETASRLRGRLEALFSFAIATGKMAGTNPAVWRGNLDFFLASAQKLKSVKHYQALDIETIRRALDETNWQRAPIAWSCIAFCALTASRVNEAARAMWDEINFEQAVWSCPRRKDGKDIPHRVPLSRQALEILQRINRFDGSPYIFPGRECPSKHLCLETPRVMIKKRCGEGTMHGFRSTFRDWAAENGIDRVLAEKALMHATGNAVEQAYQRSDLLEQRRPVMQAWADAIMPMSMLTGEEA